MKAKRASAAAAGELYTSQLFRSLRAYAVSHADRWYILSAEHGLLAPDRVIPPYERTLNTMSKSERIAWAERVQRQLMEVLPPAADVIVLAGARYREGLVPFLRKRGFTVAVPLGGLSIGRQLQWLKRANERGSDGR